MKNGFKIGEKEYDVALSRAAEGYLLHMGDDNIPFNLVKGETGDWVLQTAQGVEHVVLASHGDDVYVHLNGETHHLRYDHPLQRLAELAEGSAEDTVRATMPGSLVSLAVETGQKIAKGETLLVMESMKMETTVVAPRDGVVEEVHVAAGETFDKDALLVTLAAGEAE